MKIHVAAMCALLLSGFPASAQMDRSGGALTVEHSVPFGVIPGKLLLLGDYLVFVDDQQLNNSFVVPRSVITDFSAEGSTVTVQTNEAVRNRSGEVSRISFRIISGGDSATLTNWYGSGSGSGSTASRAAPTGGSNVYQARHNHRFGDCRGRLIVSADQISYESVSSADHSRRWEYKSIRQIKLPNPYELEVEPFSGGTYKILLDGSGMDPAAYRAIVDRVASARSTR